MTTALIGSGSGIIDLVFSKTIDTTAETIAFHYGNFSSTYYGGEDATVDAAAANGRVYADTVPGELPTEFGSIGTTTTASGQTTYTWTPPSTTRSANVLLVAGGGGGGGSAGGGASGAGGGAGGLIFDTDRAIPSGQQTIVVGDGGTAGGSRSDTPGGNGGNSSAFTLTAVGGGGGGCRAASNDNNANGLDGGSGGGEGSQGVSSSYGSGTTGQGYRGGLDGFSGSGGDHNASGGGGGASSVGGNGLDNNYSGDGGVGLFVGVFGETYGESGWFAGGGGGGIPGTITNAQGLGGLGGGGDGGNTTGVAGAAHTGGGGGGAGSDGIPARGGSGVVLVRYIMDNNLIFSNYVVNRGLAVLLDAADTASYSGTGTTWTDISGNGRNGTLQGSVSWVDQGSASYFDFSGANADYINQTAGTTQIYKDICIVFQREDDDWNYLLANSTTSDRALRIIGSSLRIPGSSGDWTQTGTTYYVNGIATTTAVPLPQNQWHILGGENKNATLLGSVWNYYLGTGYTQDNRNLNGKIAFLALYTEPLTAAEHIHNYNALKHRFGV